MSDLEFFIVLLLATAALVRLADLVAIPYPIVLVFGGIAAGVIPGLPDIAVQPDVVFIVFLPPLLHAAGFSASPRELRAEKGPLGFLAITLVVVTMVAVAVVAHTIADLSWAAAFVLGAVVAPTDPVSAAATFQRLGIPDRVSLLVEGEAMINDASALVAYRVAVAAAVSGVFQPAHAALDFVVSAVGGIAVGLVVGWLDTETQRRLEDPPLAIFLTVGFAYGAYILAEQIGVSGVLAAVVSGIYLGWHSPNAMDADTRLSGIAFWRVLVFGLNAMLFMVLGLEFPSIITEVQRDISVRSLVGAGLVVSAIVIAVRVAAQFVPFAIPGLGWRERLVVGWSGMRGAISLAAALAIPLTVGERPQILFLTAAVVAVTLIGQGLTLAPLLRALRIESERPWSPDEAIARLEAAQSALDRIDELEEEGAPEEQLRRLRELYRARFRACQAVLGGDTDGRPPPDPRLRYGPMRKELIGVERDTLLELRDQGRVKPDVLRAIQRDLDLEEARLRT